MLYDDAGNVTSDKLNFKYYYDYENRLTKMTNSGGTPIEQYSYDAMGRRVRGICN